MADPLGLLPTQTGDPLGIMPARAAAPKPPAAAPAKPKAAGTKAASGLGTVLEGLDVPLSLMEAFAEQGGGKNQRPDALKNAWHLLSTQGPGALNAQYSPLSERVVQMDKNADPISHAIATNPAARAAYGFAAETVNPSNLVLGPLVGAAGKVVGAASKAARMIPAIDRAAGAVGQHVVDPVLDTFSRFRPLRRRAGVAGEAVGRNMIDRAGAAASHAVDDTRRIFGPIGKQTLNQDLQVEIVRRSQGLLPRPMPPEIDAELTQRAQLLRQSLQHLDSRQIGAGAIKKVSDHDRYFPMYGQYVDPSISSEERELLGDLTPNARTGANFSTRMGTAAGNQRKVHQTIDDAIKSQALRPDFSPAQAFLNHLVQRSKNVEFETAIRNAPPQLAQKIGPEMYIHPKTGDNALAGAQRINSARSGFGMGGAQSMVTPDELMRNPQYGYELTVPKGFVRGESVQQILGSSPAAKEHVLAPELVNFIKDAGATAPQAQGLGRFLDTINRLTRIGIITNPVTHPGWNLLNQYLGARGDIGKLGYIATGKGWSAAAKWEQLAGEHGAHVHFATTTGLHGTEMGRLITGEGSKLERVGTKAWDANQKIVFDTFEKRFASALFADKVFELERAGVTGTEAFQRAGIDVRRELGDYANVHQNPASVEGKLNRALFFYPWLKTVMSSWAKNIVRNPSSVSAPAAAIGGWNSAKGDPSGNTKAFTLYEGKDQKNRDTYAPLPLPQRILEHEAEMIAPAGDLVGGLGGRAKAVLDIAGGHANPGLSTMMDAIYTQAAPAQDPGGGNYHVLYNKNAPIGDALKGVAGGVARRMVPPPVRGVTENVGDWRAGDFGSLQGLLGVTPYKVDPAGKDRAAFRLEQKFDRRIKALRRAGDQRKADDLYRLMETLKARLEQ